MQIDLSQLKLRAGMLSDRPFQIVRDGERSFVTGLMETLLLEGAAKETRAQWQSFQLRNLITHAQSRSPFWKSRLALTAMDPRQIHRLPPLTRKDLAGQVEKEGSLIRPEDGTRVRHGSTSGSSGSPVHFFVTEANDRYNHVRYQLDDLVNNRLHLNRARFRNLYPLPAPGFTIQHKSKEEASRTSLFAETDLCSIRYAHFEPGELLKAIETFSFEVWISNPGFMEAMLSRLAVADLHRAGLRQWLAMSGRVTADLRSTLEDGGIKVRSSYSSEENGPIGFECTANAGHYHVVSSNVIVHPSKEEFHVDGVACNRLLVTHLHSYATPFIRYDLGDLGRVSDGCACGFDGQVITHLFGRVSSALRHADGRRSGFNPKIEKIGGVREYRARQVSFTKVVVDVVPESEGSVDHGRLHDYLCAVAGPGIEVDITYRDAIDWGQSAKRPGFRCEIA